MKPQLRAIIGDTGAAGDLFATPLTFRGRDAWLLKTLVEKGEAGVTAFDEVGPRLSHYAFKLRKAGVVIETKDESHGGPFAGTHGRYVLRSRVRILEEAGL
jgi:hypothetical protein